MMGRRGFSVILLILLSGASSFAQIEQPKRFEIPIKIYEKSYEVINLKEKGVVLYRQSNDRSRDGYTWEFIFLNSDLEEVWENKYVFPFELTLAGYASNQKHFYLLFYNEKVNKKEFVLFEFNFAGDSPDQYSIKNLFPINLSHFEVSNKGAVIGGFYNYKPVAIFFDFEARKPLVLPTIYNKNSEIVQIKIHEDNKFTVLVSEQTLDKRSTLAIKHYEEDGTLIATNSLEPNDGNHFIFGRVAGDESGALLVAGTYSTHKSEFSRGIFISRLDTDGEQNSNYYNYGDLKNFFTYLKAKRQKRLKERISRKKIKGQKLRFNYRLLVNEIIDRPDGFVMLGEAFYPKYANTTSSMNRIDRESPVSSDPNRLYLEGYRYTHAVVIGFDEKGRVKWDNSFEISDVLSNSLDQYVHATFDGNNIVLLYLFENSIRTKIIRGDSVIEGKTYNDLKLTFEDDQVKNTDFEFGGLDHWYKNTFIGYGVQRIKNSRDVGVELHRRVFFVNKLIYN